mgnify:CR=1 FL=1
MMTNAPQPQWRSWVESANAPETHFPIQNLPYGVFSPGNNARARVGVAIGDFVLDLSVLEAQGLLKCAGKVFDQPALNDFIAQGQAEWRNVRATVAQLLLDSNSVLRDNAALRDRCLVPRFASPAIPTFILQKNMPRMWVSCFATPRKHYCQIGLRCPSLITAGLRRSWSAVPPFKGLMAR